MAFLGYFKSNLMQIPAGEMFVKAIFTSAEGPIFVYVTLYNPSALGGFLVAIPLLPKLLSLKSPIYSEHVGKTAVNPPDSVTLEPHQSKKYLFYKVACLLCNPTQCNSLWRNLFHF